MATPDEKTEAIHTILERLATNEEAVSALVGALMEDPEVVVTNPRIALAFLDLVGIRMESGRIIEQCREVLDA